MIYIHHYNIIQGTFIALNILCFLSTPPFLQSLATIDLFIVSVVVLFPEGHIIEILQYVVISDWLLSFSNMNLKFLHVFS